MIETVNGVEDETPSPTCSVCGLNHPFELPDELVKYAHEGSLVIFAGAGVSTEVPAVFPATFYSDLSARLSAEPNSEQFPDVMSQFELEQGRPALVEEIWKRFDYASAFSRLRHVATRFHRELATMPYVNDIITTNWDPYFEEECGALPIIQGEDYALVKINRRKVYKIHGSINVISSLVATREDYLECLTRLSTDALGSTIRHLIATRPSVFIGYSLADPDFQEIYAKLTRDMGKMRPPAYFVGPYESTLASEFGMKQITTDGTFFLHKLKSALINEGCFLPDSVYARVESFARRCRAAFDELQSIDHVANPGILYCHFYLNGVTDATDRISVRRATGEYSGRHHVRELCRNYSTFYGRAIQLKRFDDAAYIEGYLNSLVCLLVEDEDVDAAPPFFCFTDRSLMDLDDTMRAVRNIRKRNREAWLCAKEINRSYGDDVGFIPVHTPFLGGIIDDDFTLAHSQDGQAVDF